MSWHSMVKFFEKHPMQDRRQGASNRKRVRPSNQKRNEARVRERMARLARGISS